MSLQFPKILLILPVFTVLALAGDDARPVCNAKSLGLLWPEPANSDPKLLGKLARCGELSICTRRTWRYRWDSAVVTLAQLRRPHASTAKAGCDVPRAEEPPRSTSEIAR